MKRNDTAAHFPLFPVLIDLSQKHVFLITDGNCDDETILRILRMVRPCTPYLTVLAPSPSPVLERSAGKQQAVLMKKEYDREDLYGADVVICAAQDRALKDDVFYKNTKNKLAAAVLKKDLYQMKKSMDVNEVGGTALIGISKPVIKAHGSSNADSFFAAIRQAKQFAESGIIDRITENIDYMKIRTE